MGWRQCGREPGGRAILLEVKQGCCGAGSHSAVQSHPLGLSRCSCPPLALPRGVGDQLPVLRGDPAVSRLQPSLQEGAAQPRQIAAAGNFGWYPH